MTAWIPVQQRRVGLKQIDHLHENAIQLFAKLPRSFTPEIVLAGCILPEPTTGLLIPPSVQGTLSGSRLCGGLHQPPAIIGSGR
jgi:hypothetical protein